MIKKITLAFPFILLTLLFVGCNNRLEQGSETLPAENIESNIFDDNYRPSWWENLDNSDFLYSYAYVDGSDQEKLKVEAIASAQAKLLHYKKKYVVNLTQMILTESEAKEKFKSNSINAKNDLIYKKDYSPLLKTGETDIISKDENNYRCFVAVGLPLEAIQKEFVYQFQKNKNMASTFSKSKTYQYLLKIAGIEVIQEKKITKKETIKEKSFPAKEVETKKYDSDVIPAWFKISYNNQKVMVNQFAVAESENKSIDEATAQCNKAKMQIADNFARSEVEKYRKASEYDEIKFGKLKNQISDEIKNNNYPLTKENIKTIQIGENSFKSYVQYSISKKSLQNTIMKVLRNDEVLYSRLRASMVFDELEDEDF